MIGVVWRLLGKRDTLRPGGCSSRCTDSAWSSRLGMPSRTRLGQIVHVPGQWSSTGLMALRGFDWGSFGRGVLGFWVFGVLLGLTWAAFDDFPPDMPMHFIVVTHRVFLAQVTNGVLLFPYNGSIIYHNINEC